MDLKKQSKDILEKCVNDILKACGLYTNDEIDAIVAQAQEDMGIGKCCFCGDDCNPMSQSCGSCARGMSGAVLGLPVPEYLKQFL
jgi:hypothetical protein